MVCALAACATRPHLPPAPTVVIAPPPVAVPSPPRVPPQTAIELGIRAGPAFADLPGWSEADLKPALDAFRKACRALAKRSDPSGVTIAADWTSACTAAAAAPDPRGFFESEFATAIIGEGTGLNTGYFEPELIGSRTNQPATPFPLYRRPPEIIEVDLGQFAPSLKGKRLRGHVVNGTLVPFYDRGQIEDGALAGRNLELAWAADPYELFFLQIQGSGRLRLADGSVMRVGYDGQNGRDYVGIGRVLRERNLLAPGQATMEGIVAWLKANQDAGKDLMRQNKSYVFFKELIGPGPLGALNVALTPEVSVAADPKFTPLGAPLWLDTAIPEPVVAPAPGAPTYAMTPFRHLMVAQDTGGAIKGANRFDIFWGPGERARAVAGGLSNVGRAVFLLPKSALARVRTLPAADATPARP